jgi:HEAT repeat protein
MFWRKSPRLDSPNPKVRRQAVLQLAESPDPQDTQFLVASLEDPDCEVRATAVRVLGQRADPTATGPLTTRLSDPSLEVRSGAASALRQLGWKPATGEEQARFEIALGHAQAAAFVGRAALNPLLAELKHDTSFQRRAAAEALGEMQDPRRVGPLLDALQDPDPTVRISAIHALEEETDEEVSAELLKLFWDVDPHVRLAAARVLAGRPELPPAHFLPLLEDAHFEVRLAAVQFLGRQFHPQIAEALLPRLGDSDNDVRQAAAVALGHLRYTAALEPLVLALADEESSVRVAADHALNQIDSHWPQSEAARQVLGQLETLLGQRPAWVRSAILQTVAKIKAAA